MIARLLPIAAVSLFGLLIAPRTQQDGDTFSSTTIDVGVVVSDIEASARFYGKTDNDVFELSPMEGIFIPDGQDYWFESASEKPLKILRMSARDPRAVSKRLNYEDLKRWQDHLGGERVARR